MPRQDLLGVPGNTELYPPPHTHTPTTLGPCVWRLGPLGFSGLEL